MQRIHIPSINELYETPVPAASSLRALRKGWQKHPLKVHAEGVHDLIDIRMFGIRGANHYHQENVAPYHMRIPGSIPHLLLRSDVAGRLCLANNYLRDYGMELFVFDAWRPQEVQFYCRNEWFPAYLRSKHPHWSDAKVHAEVNRYWADAYRTEAEIDQSCPPPHSTGAAVDLTIRAVDGPLLCMGSGFDDCSDMSHVDAYEHDGTYLHAPTAKMNRRVLVWLMHSLGFVGHPNEWWHYSFGDQAWAAAVSHQMGVEVPARYGAVNPLPFLEE